MFEETKHRRGQPGNKGQFASGGGGSSSQKTAPSQKPAPYAPGGMNAAPQNSPQGHAQNITALLSDPSKVTKDTVAQLVHSLQKLTPEQLKQVQKEFHKGKMAGAAPHEVDQAATEQRHNRIRQKLSGMKDSELNYLAKQYSQGPQTPKSQLAQQFIGDELKKRGGKSYTAEQRAADPEGTMSDQDRAERRKANEAMIQREKTSSRINEKLAGMTSGQLDFLHKKFSSGPKTPKAERALQFISEEKDRRKLREGIRGPSTERSSSQQPVRGEPLKVSPDQFDRFRERLKAIGSSVANKLRKVNKASPFLDRLFQLEKDGQAMTEARTAKLLTENQRAAIALKYQRRQEQLSRQTQEEISKLAKERARSFVITSDMDQSTVSDSLENKPLQYCKNPPPAPETLPPKIEVHVHPEIKVEIPPIQMPEIKMPAMPAIPAFPEIKIPPAVVNVSMPEPQEMDVIPVRGEDGKVTRYKKIYKKNSQ